MKNKAVKYICVLLTVFIAATGTLCAVAYCCDPQNVYRWNTDGVRFFNPTYSTPSAVKNYDYDYVIIGSSMVQNFDAQHFAEELGCKPLKLTIGAMTPAELMWLYSCAQEQDKADHYVINLDLHRFAASETVAADSGRFPEYMYSTDGISQFKYLLGYETWFRFIPLQIMLTATDSLNIGLPAAFQSTVDLATDINMMSSWDDTDPPGEEKLYSDFNENRSVFNEVDSSVFNKNAQQNMDIFLAQLESMLDSDEELTIFLPPYSSLYWAEKNDEQMQVLFELRTQIAIFAANCDNIHLLDLQAEEYVTNLNSYIDASHYSASIRLAVETDVIECTGEPSSEQVEQNNKLIKSYAQNARAQAQARIDT